MKNWFKRSQHVIANLVTIFGFPLVLIGLYFNYVQIQDILVKPEVELFVYRQGVDSFTVILDNISDKPARGVRLELRLANISDPNPNVLKFLPLQDDFIAPRSSVGPYFVKEEWSDSLPELYFGTAMLECDSCDREKGYIVYLNPNNPDYSFYVRINNTKDKQFLFDKLNVSSSLDFLSPPFPNPFNVPPERREKVSQLTY